MSACSACLQKMIHLTCDALRRALFWTYTEETAQAMLGCRNKRLTLLVTCELRGRSYDVAPSGHTSNLSSLESGLTLFSGAKHGNLFVLRWAAEHSFCTCTHVSKFKRCLNIASTIRTWEFCHQQLEPNHGNGDLHFNAKMALYNGHWALSRHIITKHYMPLIHDAEEKSFYTGHILHGVLEHGKCTVPFLCRFLVKRAEFYGPPVLDPDFCVRILPSCQTPELCDHLFYNYMGNAKPKLHSHLRNGKPSVTLHVIENYLPKFNSDCRWLRQTRNLRRDFMGPVCKLLLKNRKAPHHACNLVLDEIRYDPNSEVAKCLVQSFNLTIDDFVGKSCTRAERELLGILFRGSPCFQGDGVLPRHHVGAVQSVHEASGVPAGVV